MLQTEAAVMRCMKVSQVMQMGSNATSLTIQTR